MSKEKFYKILYDHEDFIAIRNRKAKDDGDFVQLNNNASVEMMSYGMQAEYICLNPVSIDSDGSPKNANIYTYRNILMEEDGGISIEEQRTKIKESGLPYSTVVYSGNESAHHIISLESSLKDEDEYRRWFKTIEKILALYNFKADKACKNPSRLTRAAEGINIKTKKKQDILELKSRINNGHMLEWFKQHDMHPDDLIQEAIEYTTVEGPDSADDDRRWEVAKLLMGKDFDYATLGDGEREPARFVLALKAKECGLSQAAAQHYMCKEFPSSKGDKKTQADVKRVYETREVQRRNVMSKEDYIAQKDAQKKETNLALFDNLLNDEYNLRSDDDEPKDLVIDPLADTELHRYILVGDDIYFLANRRLYKRKPASFTLHFPKRELLNVPRYTDFCNEPGYFNFQPVVNNHYNKFKMPLWKPSKGDWSTIEHYLRHITNQKEDKYQMLLDYFQISLEDPKQKLPILLLLSYEKSSGKSTFFDLLQSVFGENVVSVTPRNFELEWNSQWCEKHFVFVDEMEKIKDKEGLGGKIKNLVYFPSISKNKKGLDTESIPWNGRFVMTSNEETGFMEIDQYEDRWLALRVPKRTSFDKDYVNRLRSEAKYFVYYLSHRIKSTQNEGRGWFTKEQLKTDALDAIVHNSKPQIEIDIDRVITEWFEKSKADTCYFLLSGLSMQLGGKYTDKETKECLHRLYGIINKKKYTAIDSFNEGREKQAHWFSVKRESILTNEDLNSEIEETFNALSL